MYTKKDLFFSMPAIFLRAHRSTAVRSFDLFRRYNKKQLDRQRIPPTYD